MNNKSIYAKWGAIISLVMILLLILAQSFSIYRIHTIRPLVPDSTMLAIDKEYLITVVTLAVCGIVAGIFYFHKKYAFVILTLFAFIAGQYIIYS